jgi:hypothetical protein
LVVVDEDFYALVLVHIDEVDWLFACFNKSVFAIAAQCDVEGRLGILLECLGVSALHANCGTVVEDQFPALAALDPRWDLWEGVFVGAVSGRILT